MSQDVAGCRGVSRVSSGPSSSAGKVLAVCCCRSCMWGEQQREGVRQRGGGCARLGGAHSASMPASRAGNARARAARARGGCRGGGRRRQLCVCCGPGGRLWASPGKVAGARLCRPVGWRSGRPCVGRATGGGPQVGRGQRCTVHPNVAHPGGRLSQVQYRQRRVQHRKRGVTGGGRQKWTSHAPASCGRVGAVGCRAHTCWHST